MYGGIAMITITIFLNYTPNYDHPMFEDGVQLVDMVYLKKDLTHKGA